MCACLTLDRAEVTAAVTCLPRRPCERNIFLHPVHLQCGIRYSSLMHTSTGAMCTRPPFFGRRPGDEAKPRSNARGASFRSKCIAG